MSFSRLDTMMTRIQQWWMSKQMVNFFISMLRQFFLLFYMPTFHDFFISICISFKKGNNTLAQRAERAML